MTVKLPSSSTNNKLITNISHFTLMTYFAKNILKRQNLKSDTKPRNPLIDNITRPSSLSQEMGQNQ